MSIQGTLNAAISMGGILASQTAGYKHYVGQQVAQRDIKTKIQNFDTAAHEMAKHGPYKDEQAEVAMGLTRDLSDEITQAYKEGIEYGVPNSVPNYIANAAKDKKLDNILAQYKSAEAQEVNQTNQQTIAAINNAFDALDAKKMQQRLGRNPNAYNKSVYGRNGGRY